MHGAGPGGGEFGQAAYRQIANIPLGIAKTGTQTIFELPQDSGIAVIQAQFMVVARDIKSFRADCCAPTAQLKSCNSEIRRLKRPGW